jgi:hypothetical protein
VTSAVADVLGGQTPLPAMPYTATRLWRALSD